MNGAWIYPGHLFRRAHQLHLQTFFEVVGSEMTPPQFAVLKVLDHAAGTPLEQGDVARRASLDKSTASELLKRMHSRGLLRRYPDEADARCLLREITGEGRHAYSASLEKVLDVNRRLAAALTDSELATLCGLLETVLKVRPAKPSGVTSDQAEVGLS